MSTVPGTMGFFIQAVETPVAAHAHSSQRAPATTAWFTQPNDQPQHSKPFADVLTIFEHLPLTTSQEQSYLHAADQYNIGTPRQTSSSAAASSDQDSTLTLHIAGPSRRNPNSEANLRRREKRSEHTARTMLALTNASSEGSSASAAAADVFFYPWWPIPSNSDATEGIYHSRTRLEGGREGLLVDPGAFSNLMGSKWMERQAKIASDHGRQAHTLPLESPLRVEGVGKLAQQCNHQGVVPLGIRELEGDGEFRAPIIPDSDVPGLLGLTSLAEKSAVLDCKGKQLIFPGPGGINMQLSPGSIVIQLENAPSGHLLIPVSEFKNPSAKSNQKRVTFVAMIDL